MKKMIFISFICISMFFCFCINSFGYNFLSTLPIDSSKQKRFIVFDEMSNDYVLYNINMDVCMTVVNNNDLKFKSTGGDRLWNIYKINVTDSSSPYFNKWTSFSSNNHMNVYGSVTIPYSYVVYTNFDIVTVDSYSTVFFAISSSIDLVNNDAGENNSGGFSDAGIIIAVSDMANSLSTSINNMSNSLNVILSSINGNAVLIKNALYVTVSDIQYSASQLLFQVNENVIGVKNKLGQALVLLEDLPANIAIELDTLLNPDSEHLPGSFGSTASDAIENKFSIVNDMKTVFNSVANQNKPLAIGADVKVGAFTIPVHISFSWYEPYREHIRSGLGGLFWIMCLISSWSVFSGIFGIGVKTGVGAYMDFQETKGFDPELTERLKSLGYHD